MWQSACWEVDTTLSSPVNQHLHHKHEEAGGKFTNLVQLEPQKQGIGASVTTRLPSESHGAARSCRQKALGLRGIAHPAHHYWCLLRSSIAEALAGTPVGLTSGGAHARLARMSMPLALSPVRPCGPVPAHRPISA